MFEKIIKKIQPKHYWILAFMLGSIAMFVMLSYSEMLSTGRYTIFVGDELKLCAYIRMIWRSILKGESIRYSFTTSLGMDTSLILAYDFFSPFNILYLILYRMDPRIVMALVIILKTGSAAAAFQLFVSKGMKIVNITSVVWAIFYSMCEFAVFFGLCNNMWADALYLLPLVCLCLIIAVQTQKYYYLIIGYATTFIIQFYMGYMIGVFTFLIFILTLFSQKEFGIKEKAKHAFLFFFSVLVAICVSAVVWLPALYWIKSYTATDTGSFSATTITIFDVIRRFSWGEKTYAYSELPNLYSGLPCIVLVPCFFFQKEISVRERMVTGILLAIYLLAIFVTPLNALMHAFDIPDGFSYRFAFVISFLICVICVREANELNINSIVRVLLPVFFFCVCFLFGVISECVKKQDGYANCLIRIGMNIALFTIWVLITRISKTQRKKLMVVSMLFLAVAEVSSNGIALWYGMDRLSETAYENWKKNQREIVEKVRTEEDYYRVVVQNDLCDDSDSFWGYFGIEDFGTAEIPSERSFMSKMGFFTSAKLVHATGITPVTEMVLGIKYRFIADDPYKIVGAANDAIVKENPYRLSIGFATNPSILITNLEESNAFDNQNKMICAMTGGDELFSEISKDYIVYKEDGLRIEQYGEKLKIVREDFDRPAKMVISVVSDKVKNAYLQFDYDYPGLYFYSPIVEGAENIMNIEETTSDRQVRGAAIYEMEKTEEGFSLSIYSYNLDDCPVVLQGIHIYQLDEVGLSREYLKLKEQMLQINELGNGYLRGTISTKNENELLLLSIPYLRGWTASLNGKPATIIPIFDGAFMGIRIAEPGDNSITLEYHNPVLIYGAGVSIIGILIWIVYILVYNKVCTRIKWI